MNYRNIKIPLILLFLSLFCVNAFSHVTESADSLEVVEETVNIIPPLNSPDELEEFISFAEADTIMRLAVVLSDIYSKKDMEFTRGLLMGIKNNSLPESSISLKLINGEIPGDSLSFELESFAPHVIIDTFEKDSPVQLLAYTQQNGNKLIKVFDAKGDEYLYTPGLFQLLVPSATFNGNLTNYFLERYSGDTLLIIGDPDPSDPMIRDLIVAWPIENLQLAMREDLENLSFNPQTNYLILPVYNGNREVKEVLSEVIRMMAEAPEAGVRLIGRPNWVTFNDLSSMIANLEVFIPAKCYFEPSSDMGKRFITDYNNLYGHTPIRSYPVYAVMGYDAATYFLPPLLEELKGVKPDWEPRTLNQSYFNLKKSDWAGFYNRGGYMLHYEPWGTMKKELID